MYKLICANCIFWGKGSDTLIADKKVLVLGNQYRVRRCNWRPHPSVESVESFYTEEYFSCNEFKEAKNAS